MRTFRVLAIAGGATLFALAGCARDADRTVSEAVARADAARPAEEPEEVVRRFLKAMVTSDEQAVREVAIDRPGMAILWEHDPTAPADSHPPDPSVIDALAMRRVRVGEELWLPGRDGPRRKLVTEYDVNDGHVMIMTLGNPIPFFVIRLDGKWRVEPGTFIAARLKAREIRLRKAAGTGDVGT